MCECGLGRLFGVVDNPECDALAAPLAVSAYAVRSPASQSVCETPTMRWLSSLVIARDGDRSRRRQVRGARRLI